MSPKHIPMRTCVGCREVKPKQAMMRIVKTTDGQVEVDPKGKKPGRGAYLCLKRSCWEKALRHKSLDYALKTTIPAEVEEQLKKLAQIMPEEEIVGITWQEKEKLVISAYSGGGNAR